MTRLILLIMSITIASTHFTSCGDAQFAAQQGGTGDVKPETPPVPTNELMGLTWFWECEADPLQMPPPEAGEQQIKGRGEHKVLADRVKQGLPVTMRGRVCPPVNFARDIVFVIDVSGSMAQSDQGNDPIRSGTCGRKSAIDSIVNTISQQKGDARFGVVTFSSSGYTTRESTALFLSTDSLYADLGGTTSATNVICDALGGTNYASGLSRAKTLLENGRRDALKEIYFVSDGVPEDPDPAQALATSLKTTGVLISGKSIKVQIATVLLRGTQSGSASNDNTISNIASLDQAGKPLYVTASKATDLARIINELAANEIKTGAISYRPIGSKEWKILSIKEKMTGYDFKLPPIKVSYEEAPQGVEVKFEYEDKRGKKYENGGTIRWES
jgi:hypothetical protein